MFQIKNISPPSELGNLDSATGGKTMPKNNTITDTVKILANRPKQYWRTYFEVEKISKQPGKDNIRLQMDWISAMGIS